MLMVPVEGLVVCALFGLVSAYVWFRLFRAPGFSPWVQVAGFVALSALCVSMVGALTGPHEPDRLQAPRLVGFVWTGTLFYLFLMLASVHAGVVLDGLRRRARPGSLAGRLSPVVEPSPASSQVARDPASTARHPSAGIAADALNRRGFLIRAGAGGAAVASAGLAGVGFRNAWDVTMPEIPVRLARLPLALDGFRIVQLSDVHLGWTLGAQFLGRVVELTQRQRPDAVVITGDLIEGPPEMLAKGLAPLRRLQPRYGVYFVTGNHEYLSPGGAEPWLAVLSAMGVRVLANQRVQVGDGHAGGASFDLAGIPDAWAGQWAGERVPNLKPALAGRDPERELVLLAHQPNQIQEAEGKGVGLQLSGHTHGGQFFPLGIAVRFFVRYVAGLHRHPDGTQIYVSSGTGFVGAPLRVLAPAELPLIVLTV